MNNFKTVIVSGLQTFRALSLRGFPPDDTMRATATEWCRLLYPVRNWNDPKQLEALSEAFDTLARRAKEWPSPAMLIAALPQVVSSYRALPRGATITAQDCADIDAFFDEIFRNPELKKALNEQAESARNRRGVKSPYIMRTNKDPVAVGDILKTIGATQ